MRAFSKDTKKDKALVIFTPTGRILRLFSAAIADQVLLSATNFAVGFLLIRYSSDRTYAMYVLVQSALLLCATIQGASLTGPVAIVAARIPASRRLGILASVQVSQRRVLRWLFGALSSLSVLAFLTGIYGRLETAVIACAVVAAWSGLHREYLRAVLLIRSQPHTLFRVDAIYAATLLLGVLLALMLGRFAIIGVVIATIGAASLCTFRAYETVEKEPGWSERGFTKLWNEIRPLGFWSLIGAVIYWIFSQSYNYLLATRLDLRAVADVNASRLILMPVVVLTVGISSLLGPIAARWYSEIGLHRLVRRLLLLLACVAVVDLLYVSVVWTFQDWLVADVFHKVIHDQRRLLLLWAAIAVVGLARDVLQCALFAQGRMRAMAGQIGLSAAAALIFTWYGFVWWGAAAVLVGQIAGELLNLMGIVWLIRKGWREASAL